jgi:hypothetical protein
LKETVP